MLTVGILLLFAAACGSTYVSPPEDFSDPIQKIEYHNELKDSRPDWTSKGLWEEDGHVYIVGQSKTFKVVAEDEAVKAAQRTATFRLSEYVSSQVETSFSEMIVSSGDVSEDLVEQKLAAKELSKLTSKSVLAKVSLEEKHTEFRLNEDEQVGVVAFAKVAVPIKVIKNAIKTAKERLAPPVETTDLADLDPTQL